MARTKIIGSKDSRDNFKETYVNLKARHTNCLSKVTPVYSLEHADLRQVMGPGYGDYDTAASTTIKQPTSEFIDVIISTLNGASIASLSMTTYHVII